jgi:ssDNA thymidine ADP-ribosyltransferase, DarT
MGFWTIVLILIFVFGWIDQLRGGSKRKTKEHFEQTPRPRQPTPVDQEPILPPGAETQRLTSDSFTGVCQEINRFTTSARESITLHMQVEEATKQLQHEMMVERVLIEQAIEHSEFLLQADKKRSAMPLAQRVSYDEAKKKYEKIHGVTRNSLESPALDYSRPDFSMPPGDHDDTMARAIRDRISSLQKERDVYIADANKTLCNTRLATHFIEQIKRLGGPETAKLLKKAVPNDVPTGRNERENATTVTAEADKAPATPLVKKAKRRLILSELLVRSAEEHPLEEAISARAKSINLPYLLHFTQVENLPSIMRNGLCPVATLAAAATSFRANDHLRLDGYKDAVSLSIAHPNDRMFAKYRWQDLQQKWAVLVYHPSLLSQYKIAFNRNNAADKRMSRMSRDERMSLEAFDAMFLPADDLPSREANYLLPSDPTDVQAELLVFDVIPSPLYLTGLVFSDADSLDACAADIGPRLIEHPVLGPRRLSIHSEGKGFFGTRTYARKTGWTY